MEQGSWFIQLSRRSSVEKVPAELIISMGEPGPYISPRLQVIKQFSVHRDFFSKLPLSKTVVHFSYSNISLLACTFRSKNYLSVTLERLTFIMNSSF